MPIDKYPNAENFQHTFVGNGNQPVFKQENNRKGHVTLWLTNQEAWSTDCAIGSETCERSGNLAYHEYKSKAAEIDQGKLLHHFSLNYYNTKGASTFTISNIRAKVGKSFCNTCKASKYFPMA